MVSDKLPHNIESGYALVEYEMCGCLIVRFNYGNNLYPFREIVKNQNNVMVPPS